MNSRNKNLRLAANNFGTAPWVSVTALSTASGYPIANALTDSRTKVYKPGGAFRITSSRDTLYINDGTDKTVTLTNGTYTGTSLASHIQTQLNASSSSWTCSYSTSTYKFTIGRTGTKTLRLSQTTNALWDWIGFTGTADQDAAAADEPRIHTEEWIKFDLGTPAIRPSLIAAVGPKTEPFRLGGAVEELKIKASNANDPDTNLGIDADITPEEAGLGRWLDDQTAQGYRYWWLWWRSRLDPNGPEYVKIGNVYIGDHVELTTSGVQNGFTVDQLDPSVELESQSGALFFDDRPGYRAFENMVVGFTTGNERRAMQQAFNDMKRGNTLYCSLDPLQQVSSGFYDLGGYFRFGRDLTVQHVLRDLHSIDLSLREVV